MSEYYYGNRRLYGSSLDKQTIAMATRWGCVGAGLVSADFFTAIKYNLPPDEHEFVAIGARDLSRAKKFADNLGFKKAYGSYDEIANNQEIEIVYIGTIHPNHAALSIQMMNAGKHVLCEKPMTMNRKQAEKVFESARQNNVFFMEGFWTMFMPAVQQIKKEIKDNSLGNIRLIRSEFCLPVLQTSERFQTPETGGGTVYSFAGYSIAIALMVFQDTPECVSASANMTSEGVDETLCFCLKFKNGGMTNVSCNATVLGENTAVIYGDKGTIKIDSPMWSPTKVTTPSGSYDFPLKEGTYNYPNSAAFHIEATAVRNYLKSGAAEAMEVPHSLSDQVVTVMDEIRRQIGYSIPEDNDA